MNKLIWKIAYKIAEKWIVFAFLLIWKCTKDICKKKDFGRKERKGELT